MFSDLFLEGVVKLTPGRLNLPGNITILRLLNYCTGDCVKCSCGGALVGPLGSVFFSYDGDFWLLIYWEGGGFGSVMV